MVITLRKEKGEKFYKYYLDGKRIGAETLSRICRKYLTDDGMNAMWMQAIDHKRCILELGGAHEDENTLLDEKIAELEKERARNARLEEKLAEAQRKAAKYILKHA